MFRTHFLSYKPHFPAPIRYGFLSAFPCPFFNMSRTLSIGKIGPDLDSFEPRPGPFSISTLLRRPWRVFPTLVFAV